MFFQFGQPALKAHPQFLIYALERVWETREHDISAELGSPDHRSDLQPLDLTAAALSSFKRRSRWHHLIYAYMIENTRVWEIFRRVVHEYLHGEKLGTPLPDAQHWLRATEAMFYSDPMPPQIVSVVSHVRPNDTFNRSDIYRRMFGMELNHGGEDGKAYPAIKADASNGTFVATFEDFLREVWVAMSYLKATASADLTDRAKIHTLITKLHDMLLSRRQNGNLAREEFAYVSTLSWFHLTVSFNSPIVVSMRAEAEGIEQRLFKIAERVGLPAHGISRSFFDIAEPISRLLIDIEAGKYANIAAVPALFTPVTTPLVNPESDMRTILTHWAAMRDIKAWK